MPPAWAQDPGIEFVRVYERWQTSKDIEERIGLAEQAVKLETAGAEWPFGPSRDQIIGELWIGLGDAYRGRRAGSGAENLEKAITAFKVAASLFNRAGTHKRSADAHVSLGMAYHKRIRGSRADNFEMAMAAYEASLAFYTPGKFPQEWAKVQNLLGQVFGQRIREGRADNIEKSIAAHEAALTVFEREAHPAEWAHTQTNIGHSYPKRLR